MSSDAVGAKEICTITAACNCLLLGLAACADDLHVCNCFHVQHIHEDIVVGQLFNAILAKHGLLLADLTCDDTRDESPGQSFLSRARRRGLRDFLGQTVAAEGVQAGQHSGIVHALITKAADMTVGECRRVLQRVILIKGGPFLLFIQLSFVVKLFFLILFFLLGIFQILHLFLLFHLIF
jgi:hypothetical protein